VSDTDSVRTLVHHDTMAITAKNGSVHVVAHGTEDEVHNREQDYESVSVTQIATGGKTAKLHYTVDLIFMNGLTYYRTSAAPTQWKKLKGMKFADPYTGGWQRGRTTVDVPAGADWKVVGTSGGQSHVQTAFKTATTAGIEDLWVTTGSKPYVAREDTSYHTTKGTAVTIKRSVRFGPFNSAVTIGPPAQASA
jgi:hypothetical protein